MKQYIIGVIVGALSMFTGIMVNVYAHQPTLSPDDRALLTVTETVEFKELTHSMALAIYSKRQSVILSQQAEGFNARKQYQLDVLDYKLAEMLAK